MSGKANRAVTLYDASGNALPSAVAADGTAGASIPAFSSMLWTGPNATFVRQQNNSMTDAQVSTAGIAAIAAWLYNGATYDRLRTALGMDGTTGTGGLGAAPMLFDGTNFRKQSAIQFVTDANAAATIAAQGGVAYNENTYDRIRNNVEFAILTSASRNTTTASSIFTLYNGGGLIVIINVTANPGGAQTLTLNVRGYGSTALLNVSGIAAQTWGGSTGASVLVVYPGATATWNGGTGNVSTSTKTPRRIDVQVTHSGAGNWTYSVDGLFLI